MWTFSTVPIYILDIKILPHHVPKPEPERILKMRWLKMRWIKMGWIKISNKMKVCLFSKNLNGKKKWKEKKQSK